MNHLVIDFSDHDFLCPESEIPWQREILSFIRFYLENEEIPVQTSGSTGEPKKLFLSKTTMQMSAQLTGEFLHLKRGDKALLCLPIQYIAGKMMIVRAVELGLKLYVVEPKTEIHFDKNIDFCAMTPMQAEASLESLSRIQKLILGGAKVSDALEEKLSHLNTQIFETYAMTETITHIAMRRLQDQHEFHLLPQIKVEQDERNCLVIQTPYFNEKIITNDVVEILSPSTFVLKGRADNVINSGGLKINPEEIENKLNPFIHAPFVIHYKADPVLGQKLVLVIASEKPFELKLPENIIPKNKMPKEIIFVPEFPRTLSGKIIRNQIKF